MRTTRGLRLIFSLGRDRVFYALAIVAALWAGSLLGTMMLH